MAWSHLSWTTISALMISLPWRTLSILYSQQMAQWLISRVWSLDNRNNFHWMILRKQSLPQHNKVLSFSLNFHRATVPATTSCWNPTIQSTLRISIQALVLTSRLPTWQSMLFMVNWPQHHAQPKFSLVGSHHGLSNSLSTQELMLVVRDSSKAQVFPWGQRSRVRDSNRTSMLLEVAWR